MISNNVSLRMKRIEYEAKPLCIQPTHAQTNVTMGGKEIKTINKNDYA